MEILRGQGLDVLCILLFTDWKLFPPYRNSKISGQNGIYLVVLVASVELELAGLRQAALRPKETRLALVGFPAMMGFQMGAGFQNHPPAIIAGLLFVHY